MSKFGVGVGDDFPVDDGNGPRGAGDQGAAGPGDERAEFEEWKSRREAHRAQRDAWRAERAQWQDRKRHFKDAMRGAAQEFAFHARDHRGNEYHGWHARSVPWAFIIIPLLVIMIPILIIALLFSMVAAIFKSPFVLATIVLGLLLIFAFRHHFHVHAGHGGHGHRHGRHRHHAYRYDPRERDAYDTRYDVDLKPDAPGTPRPQQPPSAGGEKSAP